MMEQHKSTDWQIADEKKRLMQCCWEVRERERKLAVEMEQRERERAVDWQICHEKQLLLQLGGRDGLDSRYTYQMSCPEGRIKMGVLGCRAL